MRLSRRGILTAAALSPLAWLGSQAEATDYASAAEALEAIDGLEADVAARLRRIGSRVRPARTLVDRFLADHVRHREERVGVRRRLRLGLAPSLGEGVADDGLLDGLRGQQEALVYAHAEGMPALGDALAVDLLSRHMVELARHLTVIDLWLEAEAERG